MKAVFAILCLLCPLQATAAPADCPSAPDQAGAIPLAIELQGLPGVPRGVSGQADVEVPASPNGRLDCPAKAARKPVDPLHGEPGDLLRGPPADAHRP